MLKRRLHRLVRVQICQNATLLKITCHGSNYIFQLYHACDGDRTDEFKYCALRLSILSFADFLGSALSIWITLVAMARPPTKLKAVLQIAGPLGLLFGVLYKKTSAFLFIAPAGLGLLMIFISWVCTLMARIFI